MRANFKLLPSSSHLHYELAYYVSVPIIVCASYQLTMSVCTYSYIHAMCGTVFHVLTRMSLSVESNFTLWISFAKIGVLIHIL